MAIPDKSDPLPAPNLGAFLSVEQTGLGKSGLNALMEQFG